MTENGREHQPTNGSVVVLHAAMDQLWAEWVAGHLAKAGLRPRQLAYQTGTDESLTEQIDAATRNGTRLVVVLSSRLKVVVGRTEQEWEDAVQFALDRPGLVIPVLIGGFTQPVSVWGLAPVNLSRQTDPAAARRKLLAALRVPIAEIDEDEPEDAPMRYPGDEPKLMNSYFPHRERAFTGRHAQLQRIRELFGTAEDLSGTVALHGMGGIGKTAIATEYAHRYRAAYDLVWWVNATSRYHVREQMAELGTAMGARGTEIGERVRYARDALRKGDPYRPCLLIFDGADSLADVRPELPPSSRHTHILVTSRDPNWQYQCEGVEIDVCLRQESVAYLRRMAPDLTESQADHIAETTADLPLALFHAVGWLRGGGTVGAYAATVEQLMRQGIGDPLTTPRNHRTIATTWTASFNALRDDDRSQATVLLYLLAFLAPIPVPVSLLRSVPKGILSPAEDLLLADDTSVGEMLEKIKRNALARDHGRPENLEMHPMVQLYIRGTLSGSAEEDKYRRAAQHALVAQTPGDPTVPGTARRYSELIVHFQNAGITESAEPKACELVLNAAESQLEQGEYKTTLALVEAAERSWSRHMDQANALLLKLRRNKAIALRGLGFYEQQLSLDQENYELASRAFGEHSERALRAAGGISAALTWLGRLTEAREWTERFYEGSLATFGPDNRDTLRAAYSRANFLRLAGNFQESLKLDEATHAKFVELLGPEHPFTLNTRTSIARDLRELGRCQEALALQEANLADCRQFLGRWSPSTLAAMSELVIIRRRAGRFEQSYELSDRTLELYAARYEHEHLQYLSVLTNHAGVLRPVGRVVQGRAMAEQAYQGTKAQLGPEHPIHAVMATNYAVFLRYGADAEPQTALRLDQEAVQSLAQVLGATNHYTLAAQINLANSHAAAGNPDEARRLHEDAYRTLHNTRGAAHGHTLVAAFDLVLDLEEQGDLDAARELRETLAADRGEAPDDSMTPWESAEIAAGRRLSCDLDLPLF